MKLLLVLVVFILLVMPSQAVDPLKDLFSGGHKVVARGVGFQVTRSELDEAMRIYLMNAAAEGNVIPPEEKLLERNLLDDLVVTRLLIKRAVNQDKNQAYTRARADYLKERNKYTSDIAFKIRVGAMGVSTNIFRKRLYDSTLAKVVFDREITSKVVVTDAQTLAYYNSNKLRWTTPESVRTAHIMFATINPLTGLKLLKAEKVRKMQQALAIRKRALAGEEFTKLVLEFSEDSVTRDTGGESTFKKSELSQEIRKVVFSMQPGQISGVVETKLGYLIIRLIEKTPRVVKAYSQVQAEIRKLLAEQKAVQRLPGFYTQLRKAAKVEVLLKD